jgi:hypothetical protein
VAHVAGDQRIAPAGEGDLEEGQVPASGSATAIAVAATRSPSASSCRRTSATSAASRPKRGRASTSAYSSRIRLSNTSFSSPAKDQRERAGAPLGFRRADTKTFVSRTIRSTLELTPDVRVWRAQP